jgi:hypothetical protein
MTIGPDGNVYVVMDDTSTDPETVGRFNRSGEPLGTFAVLGSSTFANDLIFGPDGSFLIRVVCPG